MIYWWLWVLLQRYALKRGKTGLRIFRSQRRIFLVIWLSANCRRSYLFYARRELLSFDFCLFFHILVFVVVFFWVGHKVRVLFKNWNDYYFGPKKTTVDTTKLLLLSYSWGQIDNIWKIFLQIFIPLLWKPRLKSFEFRRCYVNSDKHNKFATDEIVSCFQERRSDDPYLLYIFGWNHIGNKARNR